MAETASVTGRGFQQTPTITGSLDSGIIVTGRGFSQSPNIYGGAIVTGRGFSYAPTITGYGDETAYITGVGFETQPTITAVAGALVSVTGRGFYQAPGIYGGAVVTGRGFSSTLSALADKTVDVQVTGRGFTTEAFIRGYDVSYGVVTGRGFTSGLAYNSIIGRGFLTTPVINGSFTADFAEAFVMNMLGKDVTRYQNFPFMHIARIDGSYYGVKSDGLYLLDGTDDIDTPVNGTIVTNDSDFGDFHSKNIHTIYFNGDDNYQVTPTVDSVERMTYSSSFGGRKAKLARGNIGRYWAFKIEGINKLNGLEFLVHQLSRRIK